MADGTETKADAVADAADKIAANVTTFLTGIREWVEVVTCGFVPTGFSEVSPLRSGDLYFWSVDGPRRTRISAKMNSLVAHSESDGSLNRRTWMQILEHVRCNTQPPIARVLLAAAYRSILRNDTRKSTIDAGTAAELALAKILDDKLARIPSPVAEVVVGAAQGLARLVHILRNRFGVDLPSEIHRRLGEPRNRTVHAGERPSVEVALGALKVAWQIVDLAHPDVPINAGTDHAGTGAAGRGELDSGDAARSGGQ
jgi:hypothetical protein